MNLLEQLRNRPPLRCRGHCHWPSGRSRRTTELGVSEQFTWHLDDLGISHRKTKICTPEENGKVERSHRTDQEEFYGITRFVSIHHCMKLFHQWEKEYNEERPHMALKGKTPKEYLMQKLQNHVSRRSLISPLKSVREVG